MNKIFSEPVLDIVKRITNAYGDVYLVGGAVRDIISKKEPGDIDLVTNLRPEQIIALFPEKELELEGKSFGVIRAHGIEIATYRNDVYIAEQYHKKGADSIEYAKTIEEDLARRDFTMNAMAIKLYITNDVIELSDIIIDPFGGQEDLRMGIVKFVGDPEKRIIEDPCRMLRAMRFADDKMMDNSTLGAIMEHRSKFLLIEVERVQMELMKVLMKNNHPSTFFWYLRRFGMLQYIFPSLSECSGLDGGPHHGEDVFMHCVAACDVVSKKYPMIRLAALLHDVGKPQTVDKEGHFYRHEMVSEILVRKELKRLRFSTKTENYICELVGKHMFYFEDNASDSAYRRFMSNTYVAVRDFLRLRIADQRANAKKKNIGPGVFAALRRIRKIEKDNNAFKIKDLKINGETLMEMGYEPGPIYKEIFGKCLELVVENPAMNEPELLIDYIIKEFRNEMG